MSMLLLSVGMYALTVDGDEGTSWGMCALNPVCLDSCVFESDLTD